MGEGGRGGEREVERNRRWWGERGQKEIEGGKTKESVGREGRK